MTAQEAIKVLNKPSDHIKIIPINNGIEIAYSVELVQTFEMAIEALEKQISKKPISKDSDFMGYLYCPSCDDYFDADEEYYLKYGEWNYCGKCGQKIQWGD